MTPSFAHRLGCVLSAPLPWALFGFGLRFVPSDGPRSTLAWVDWPLYLGVIGGLIGRMRGLNGLSFAAPPAGVAFVALSLACAAVYELSLTVDGTGWGGMHPDTRTSFVLAFGDYLMLALATLAALRWLRLDATGLWWLACGAALTEGLMFTGVLWQVPVVWLPIYITYYALAYATFLVLPALVLDPKSLWQPGARRPVPILVLVPMGFAGAFLIRVVWGLVYGPLATSVFQLQPPVA